SITPSARASSDVAPIASAAPPPTTTPPRCPRTTTCSCASPRASSNLPQGQKNTGPREGPGETQLPDGSATAVVRSAGGGLLRSRCALLARVAQHVAPAPHGLDVAVAAGRGLQLVAELADEHVDDLELGLVHAAVEVVEEHFLRQRRALAQRQQLEDAVLLASQMQRLALDLDHARVEIDRELAGLDDRVGVALGAAHDRLDAGDQLALIERLGEIVVGTEAEPLDLVVQLGEAGQDQDRRVDARRTQPAQHLVGVDVRQQGSGEGGGVHVWL